MYGFNGRLEWMEERLRVCADRATEFTQSQHKGSSLGLGSGIGGDTSSKAYSTKTKLSFMCLKKEKEGRPLKVLEEMAENKFGKRPKHIDLRILVSDRINTNKSKAKTLTNF